MALIYPGSFVTRVWEKIVKRLVYILKFFYLEISDPEEFDKELDELLANVSGVKIDLSDLPKEDETEGEP